MNLLQWLARRMGPWRLLSLALLLIALGSVATGLADVIRELDARLALMVTVTALLVGWGLATTSLPGWAAGILTSVLGLGGIFVQIGQLGRKLVALLPALAELGWNFFDWSHEGLSPGWMPTILALSELWGDLSALLLRVRNWMLALAAGLPARLAVGYAAGSYDSYQAHYVVTEADAHAWVEIYFPGYDWVEFESTGGLPPIERSAEAALLEWPEPEGALGPTTVGRGGSSWSWRLMASALVVLLVLPGVVWLTADGWRLHRMKPAAAVATLYRRLQRHGPRLTVPVREALMLVWISVGCWLLFEAYNIRLQNWYYVGVPEHPIERNWVYLWSFATIMPGIFETADVLEGLGFLRNLRAKPHAFSPTLLAGMFVVGLAFVTIPPLLPIPIARYAFGFVWLGFIFLLEPINVQLGIKSPLGEWGRGNPRPALRLLAAGMIAGFLWEFWNFWATSGWRYTVPWPLDFGIYYFRMPVLGLLGFPPFAWESWVMFQLLKRALRGDVLWQGRAHRDD